MYRIINALLLILGCTACSSTTVHLYTKYLNDDETQQIVNRLSNTFEVEVNTLGIPDSIEHSTVVYSPLMASKEAVDVLAEELAYLGWPAVDKVTLFQSDHWYTKNTIGVMLLPENISGRKERLTRKLANTFKGQKCDKERSLTLLANNRYQVVNSENNIVSMEGTWRYEQSPYLELSTKDPAWWYYFEIKERKEHDIVGAIALIELVALDNYQALGGCHFIHGIRG